MGNSRSSLIFYQEIISNARLDSKKVILLITDGKSNGGDPKNIAERIKREGWTVSPTFL